MAKTIYKYSFTNVRKRLEAYQTDNIDVYYSAIFYTGKQKNKQINRQPITNVESIRKHINVDLPDSFVLEIYDGKESEEALWMGRFLVKNENSEQESKQTLPVVQEFKGFGEAEINTIIEQKLQEKKRQEEFERLKIEVDDLVAELDEVKEHNEQLEDENEQLKIELEGKKQIRYYAGMLGDILEGIGISKDKIRNPIASLMGIVDEKDNKEISQTPIETQTDSSGIVEEVQEQTVEQKHRAEVVALMTEYLQTRDNLTLSNLFNIFSEVEKNPKIAFEIIAFIESKKA